MPLYSMPEISRQADRHAAADVFSDSASDTTPAPDLEVTRRSSQRGTEKLKHSPLSLKTNGQWIKKFLHGGK